MYIYTKYARESKPNQNFPYSTSDAVIFVLSMLTEKVFFYFKKKLWSRHTKRLKFCIDFLCADTFNSKNNRLYFNFNTLQFSATTYIHDPRSCFIEMYTFSS